MLRLAIIILLVTGGQLMASSHAYRACELNTPQEIQLFQKMQLIDAEMRNRYKLLDGHEQSAELRAKLMPQITKIENDLFQLFGYSSKLKFSLVIQKASIFSQDKKKLLNLETPQQVNDFRKAVTKLQKLKKIDNKSRDFIEERSLFQTRFKLDPAQHYVMISEKAELYLLLDKKDINTI